MEAIIHDGHIMHHDPGKHHVENVEDKVLKVIIFEQMPT